MLVEEGDIGAFGDKNVGGATITRFRRPMEAEAITGITEQAADVVRVVGEGIAWVVFPFDHVAETRTIRVI